MKNKPTTWLGLSALSILLVGLVVGAILASEGSAASLMGENGVVSELTLRESENLTDWSPVVGDLLSGYSLALDSGYAKYLDVLTLTADPPLANGTYHFYFDALRVPQGFWDYWASKGVVAGATGDAGTMWEIINGNTPIFYLTVNGSTTSLVDGLTGSGPWMINGDHPLGTYHFGGYVTDTDYLNLQLTLTKTATVSITPEESVIDGCGYVDVYIHLSNVHDLYAVDIELSFDPEVLEAVDLDPVTAGVNLEPVDSWFLAGYWVYNLAFNEAVGEIDAGTIRYVATQLRTTAPVDGDGNIAKIRFRAKSIGTSPIEIVSVDLSDRDGYLVGLPLTFEDGTIETTFSAEAELALDIIRLNPNDVQLSWPMPAEGSGISTYKLYRSKLPYFDVEDEGVVAFEGPFDEIAERLTFTDSVLGDVVDNYFYALQIVCEQGLTSPPSDQVGKFEYQLFETSTTDFAWIGLVLDFPGIVNSQDLANHIEANIYSGQISVLSISRWNPIGQGFTSYDHGTGGGKFDVFIKQPYRVEINIDGTTSGSVIWAQVGTLPKITQDTYTLYETATTDFTWILQPLDMVGITSTTQLAEAIETGSSNAVTVLTIARWNGTGQIFSSYVRPASSDTRFGYPYRIEVDVANGNSIIWPVVENIE